MVDLCNHEMQLFSSNTATNMCMQEQDSISAEASKKGCIENIRCSPGLTLKFLSHGNCAVVCS